MNNKAKQPMNLKSIIMIVENRWTWVLGIPGVILICFFAIPIIVTQLHSSVEFNEQTGQIGDTIGGLVSPTLGFIGIILTFAAFYIQYKANEIQKDNFYVQQFESKFFDLLKIHRENVAELSIKNNTQRAVFVILRAEYQEIYNVVADNFTGDDETNQIKADITYMFLFFGVGGSTSSLVKEITSKYSCEEAINKIETEISDMQKYGTTKTEFLKRFIDSDSGYLPFDGHQMRLGHYFRHLYQTVKFVETQKRLTFEEQQYYIKTLRAQLATHEIAIFFYNSISSIGKAWRKKEWENPKNKTEKIDLITKYELIRNLPPLHFTYDVNPKTFYPNISYEWDEIVNMDE